MRTRPCPGFEEFYVVRDDGSVIRTAPGRNARVGHALIPYIDPTTGYAQVTLHATRQNVRRVGPLICRAFHGPPTPGQEVNHKNGRKSDNRACNLEWATKSSNCRHRSRVLGKSRGAAHGGSKLTEREVCEIRRRLAHGETQTALGHEYGVTQTAISLIHRRVNWAHVP